MAIFGPFSSLQISVMAGDTALKEYQDRDEQEPDTRTVTRYIEAKSNQEFRIECEIKQGYIRKSSPGNCLAVHVYVDGSRVDQFIVTRKDVKNSNYLTESLGLDQPGGLVQKYRFSTLETVDDDVDMSEVSKLKQLGTIRVEVHWKQLIGLLRKPRGNEKPKSPKKIDMVSSVSERALKGQVLSHSVSFAAPEDSLEDAARWRSEYVDRERRPRATFVFKYRAHEALKSMLILPRTMSPDLSVHLVERDPVTLTPAEQVQVIRLLQAERKAQNETAEHEKVQRETARRETAQRKSTPREAQIKIKREHAGDDENVPPSKKTIYTQTAATKVEGSSSLRDALARSKPETIVID